MELNALYKSINNSLHTMMQVRNNHNFSTTTNKMIMQLEEHQDLLNQKASSNLIIYLLTSAGAAVCAYFVLGKWFPGVPLLLIGGSVAFSFLITYLLRETIEYKIDTAILLSPALSKRGWCVSTLNPIATWESWNYRYPFLEKGDMDDAIPLRINGHYEGFSFCYFEYEYTIETEEEVMHEDSDGNTYFETEYSYEYFTESGVIIDGLKHLPSITTSDRSAHSHSMKFSYIDLNKRMSVYSSNAHEATVFFSPSTQLAFAEFYRHYPNSALSMQGDTIVVNFGSDLTHLSRETAFNDQLLSRMKHDKTVQIIERMMHKLLPVLKATD